MKPSPGIVVALILGAQFVGAQLGDAAVGPNATAAWGENLLNVTAYRDYDQLNVFLEDVAKRFPNTVHVQPAFESVLDRDIVLVKMTENVHAPNRGRPAFLYIGKCAVCLCAWRAWPWWLPRRRCCKMAWRCWAWTRRRRCNSQGTL